MVFWSLRPAPRASPGEAPGARRCGRGRDPRGARGAPTTSRGEGCVRVCREGSLYRAEWPSSSRGSRSPSWGVGVCREGSLGSPGSPMLLGIRSTAEASRRNRIERHIGVLRLITHVLEILLRSQGVGGWAEVKSAERTGTDKLRARLLGTPFAKPSALTQVRGDDGRECWRGSSTMLSLCSVFV